MSFFKTLKLYKQLDERQKKFIKTRKIEAKYSISEWLVFGKKIAIMDKYGDKARKNLNIMRIVFGVLCTVFLTGFVSKLIIEGAFLGIGFFIIEHPEYLLLITLLIIVFLLTTFFFYRFRKVDLPNVFGDFILPFLLKMKDETNEEDKFLLKIDLTPRFEKNKLLNNEEYQKTKERYSEQFKDIELGSDFYKSIWFQGKVQFMDNALIEWKVSDFVSIDNKRDNKKPKYQILNSKNLNLKISIPQLRYKLIEYPKILPEINETDYIFNIRKKEVEVPKRINPKAMNLINYGISLSHVLEKIQQVYNSVEKKTKK